MGDTTAIAWTDHTFNPWHGCTKVSPACDNCYAETFSKRTGRAEWGDDAPRWFPSEAYWKHPVRWNAAAEAEGRRHRVFCASMADVFEDRDELHASRHRLFELIEATPWLDWQLLTKRPENVMGLLPFHLVTLPPNVWLGVTVEDQQRAEQRVPLLCALPAATRFLSCEPLLGPLAPTRLALLSVVEGVDWVIVGGESGPNHRSLDLDHVRPIRDACVFLDVPFFFKQHGGRTPNAGGCLLDGVEHKAFPDPRVAA